VIKEKPGTVFISGEVYNSGLVEYDESLSVKNYINSAGGITKNGDKNDIIIIYANGEVKPNPKFGRIKIKDGSTIIVNIKEIRDPFSATDFANTTLSLISSLVTILVLSRQI